MNSATLPLPLGIPRAIHGERNDSPVSRFRLLVASAVLGAVVGVGAIAFLAACEVVTRLALTQCAGYQPGGPAGETVLVPPAVGGSPRVWLLVPIAALGGLLSGWVTRRFAPEAAGTGSDAAIRAYYDAGGRVHSRVSVVKILATALTIGTGGSGGREGPMIQVGAGVGAWLAGWFGFSAAGRRVLLAAGMGAGVAAVFRTPLGGTLFAAEALNRSEEIESEVLIPAGTAAVTAYMTAGRCSRLGTNSSRTFYAAGGSAPLRCLRPACARSGRSRSVVRAASPPNERLVCSTPSSGGGQARSRRGVGSDHRGLALLRGRSGRARTRGSGVRAGNAATNTDPAGQFLGGIADRPGPRKARYHAADGLQRRLGRRVRTRADNRWMRGWCARIAPSAARSAVDPSTECVPAGRNGRFLCCGRQDPVLDAGDCVRTDR